MEFSVKRSLLILFILFSLLAPSAVLAGPQPAVQSRRDGALQAVRVVPIRGLFLRLARVAREAARVEGRPIEVVLIGEDAVTYQ